MAYKSLYDVECSSRVEWFCRLRDFVCKRNGTYDYSASGIGWDLIDSYYSVDEDNPTNGDYFVMKSTGENGDISCIIRIKWSSTNYTNIEVYHAWDPSTHTGSAACNTAAYAGIYDTRTSIRLHIFGDLNYVISLYSRSDTFTDYSAVSFGKVLKPFAEISNTMAVSSSAVSSGSDVSITLDAVPEEWRVGGEVYVWTTTDSVIATAKLEKTTIKTISGTVITCDLANNYTAGFVVSQHYGICCGGANINNCNMILTPSGTVGICTTSTFNDNLGPMPGKFENRYVLSRLFFQDHTANTGFLFGFIPHCYGMKNPYLDNGVSLEDMSGNQYRHLKCYPSLFVAFLEE